MKTRVALAVVVALLTAPGAAYALDPFEIQVYDGLANAPGGVALEVGVGHGVAGPSDPAIFKAILGVELARLWGGRD